MKIGAFTTLRQLGICASATSAFALIAPADAAVERVVVAMDPPSAETNLFWQTGGDMGLEPALQSLVGNDPVTGAYDNSQLAERWEVSDDFKTWTFHLKPEAEFHFGWGPVTAADVIHSYELHTQPGVTLSAIEQLRGAELEAIDEHTVAFHFEEPRTDYAFVHAGRGSMHIYSKEQYDSEGLDGYHAQPAGTGPYQYVERRPGEGVVFERVDDHWSGLTTDFPEIEMRWTPEGATKLAMLLAGEAHITNLPRELQADAVAAGKAIISSQNHSAHVTI